MKYAKNNNRINKNQKEKDCRYFLMEKYILKEHYLNFCMLLLIYISY